MRLSSMKKATAGGADEMKKDAFDEFDEFNNLHNAISL